MLVIWRYLLSSKRFRMRDRSVFAGEGVPQIQALAEQLEQVKSAKKLGVTLGIFHDEADLGIMFVADRAGTAGGLFDDEFHCETLQNLRCFVLLVRMLGMWSMQSQKKFPLSFNLAKKRRRLHRLNVEKVLWHQRDLNLTDEQLARKIGEKGVTPATLGKWLAGGELFLSNVANLARALGNLPINSLLYIDNDDQLSQKQPATERIVIINENNSDNFSLCIRIWMAELNRSVEKLTRDQHRIIMKLKDCRRARISGCAGSGKTLVAAEKAARCSIAGSSTLFLCHSPRLARYVAGMLKGTEVVVEDFGQWVRELAGIPSFGRWNNFDEPDDDTREKALYALRSGGKRYTVIVVDEGQDFRKEWWEVVEAAMDNPLQDSLYIFHDDNQALLKWRQEYPLVVSIESLSRNCRNSGKIFELMRLVFRDAPETEKTMRDLGDLRLFTFNRNEGKQSIRQAIDWLLTEGFGGDADAAAGKIVALHGGSSPVEHSPMIGTFEAVASHWQAAVAEELKWAITSAKTLKVPTGGFPEIQKKLAFLSSESYPTEDDVRIVRNIAKEFSVNHTTRGKIKLHRGLGERLTWVTDGAAVRLRRHTFERASEIILHFQGSSWHFGLPSPKTIIVANRDMFPGSKHIPVYSVSDYKGLESGCILLMIEGNSDVLKPELYIGISRARHLLAILLDETAIGTLTEDQRQYLKFQKIRLDEN